MVEHEHRFGKPEAMGESSTDHDGFDEQVFATRHALACGQHFAMRVHLVYGVNHGARLRRDGR